MGRVLRGHVVHAEAVDALEGEPRDLRGREGGNHRDDRRECEPWSHPGLLGASRSITGEQGSMGARVLEDGTRTRDLRRDRPAEGPRLSVTATPVRSSGTQRYGTR